MMAASRDGAARAGQNPLVGVVADDVTGGSDVAVALSRHGLRTALWFDIPGAGFPTEGYDAVVIALKIRSIEAADAVGQARAATQWLREQGSTLIYFKYCSTFDSTSSGNIGPVLDALADDVAADVVVTTPSSPEHGRTQYGGQLFVRGIPLAESPMRHHPLTPMTDSSLVRLLEAQSVHRAAVLPHDRVAGGTAAVRTALTEADTRYVLPDAINDKDLLTVGRALLNMPLAAGAAGLAGGIAAAITETRSATTSEVPRTMPGGAAVVLAGSCSRRTVEQVTAMQAAGRPTHRLDALRSRDAAELANNALAWFDDLIGGPAPLIYSSVPHAQLSEVQARLGTLRSAKLLESAMGRIACGLADRGVTRFIAAGGETSGAVIAALGVTGGTIGPEAARGVPWISTPDGLHLLLKSGNFGEVDFLVRASTAPPVELP